jgi:hypothetical protein
MQHAWIHQDNLETLVSIVLCFSATPPPTSTETTMSHPKLHQPTPFPSLGNPSFFSYLRLHVECEFTFYCWHLQTKKRENVGPLFQPGLYSWARSNPSLKKKKLVRPSVKATNRVGSSLSPTYLHELKPWAP